MACSARQLFADAIPRELNCLTKQKDIPLRKRREQLSARKRVSAMPRVFISYRREDTIAYAGRLRTDLARRFGTERVFMDIAGIDAGEDFTQALAAKLAQTDAVLVLIGPRWLVGSDGRRRLNEAGDYVSYEIGAALQARKRVVPVLLGGAQMPRADDLPAELAALASHQAVELSDTRWDYDVQRLAQALGGGGLVPRLVRQYRLATIVLVAFAVPALLYLAGYAAVAAQVQSLGLANAVAIEANYLLVGAEFVATLAVLLGQVLVSITYVGMIAAVVGALLLLALFRRNEPLRSLRQNARIRVLDFDAKWGWRVRLPVLTLLLVLTLTGLDARLLIDVSNISNLLFAPAPPASVPNMVRRVHELLTEQSQASNRALRTHLAEVELLMVRAAMLLALAWKAASIFRLRLVLILPFAVVLAFYLFYLPRLYGVMLQPLRFPLVSLRAADGRIVHLAPKVFQLRRTEAEFVVWDPSERKVAVVAAQRVDQIEVSAAEPILRASGAR